ncbi:MAG TPA: hypothetical protein VI195_00915, partial [Steroidobacteraceae bacterium]
MSTEHAERVLVVAPLGGDAAAIAAVLTGSGYAARICEGAAEASVQLAAGAGSLLLTEEALEREHVPQL